MTPPSNGSDAVTGSSAASMPGPLEAFKRVRDGWEQDRREGLHDEPEPREEFLPWKEHEHGER